MLSSKEQSLSCKICIDNPAYPLARNMELLLDRMRQDNFTDSILSAPRVVHPSVVLPTPLDTYVIDEEVYLCYPKVPDTTRMTPAALEDFIKTRHLARSALDKRDEKERSPVKDL